MLWQLLKIRLQWLGHVRRMGEDWMSRKMFLEQLDSGGLTMWLLTWQGLESEIGGEEPRTGSCGGRPLRKPRPTSGCWAVDEWNKWRHIDIAVFWSLRFQLKHTVWWVRSLSLWGENRNYELHHGPLEWVDVYHRADGRWRTARSDGSKTAVLIPFRTLYERYAVAQFVEALRYNPEGLGFDFRRGLWDLSLP
jgi:hypothetical protein